MSWKLIFSFLFCAPKVDHITAFHLTGAQFGLYGTIHQGLPEQEGEELMFGMADYGTTMQQSALGNNFGIPRFAALLQHVAGLERGQIASSVGDAMARRGHCQQRGCENGTCLPVKQWGTSVCQCHDGFVLHKLNKLKCVRLGQRRQIQRRQIRRRRRSLDDK